MINIMQIIDHISNKYNYYLIFFIMFLGLFNTINKTKLLHKLIGLSIFQTSIIILYLTIGFNHDTNYPVINFEKSTKELLETIYSNPLPQVLMLTAIVVGIATFAVGLSIMLAINKLEIDSQNINDNKNKDMLES